MWSHPKIDDYLIEFQIFNSMWHRGQSKWEKWCLWSHPKLSVLVWTLIILQNAGPESSWNGSLRAVLFSEADKFFIWSVMRDLCFHFWFKSGLTHFPPAQRLHWNYHHIDFLFSFDRREPNQCCYELRDRESASLYRKKL